MNVSLSFCLVKRNLFPGVLYLGSLVWKDIRNYNAGIKSTVQEFCFFYNTLDIYSFVLLYVVIFVFFAVVSCSPINNINYANFTTTHHNYNGTADISCEYGYYIAVLSNDEDVLIPREASKLEFETSEESDAELVTSAVLKCADDGTWKTQSGVIITDTDTEDICQRAYTILFMILKCVQHLL